MALGIVAALISAFCYGIAAVLQSKAAQAAPTSLVRLASRLPFLVGILLDLVGFAAQFVALRVAPVFLVQAALAASLAVTAAAAVVVLRARLSAREWSAIVAVSVALAALGWSAGPEGAVKTGIGLRVGLLVAVLLLTAFGLATMRFGGRAVAARLGATAGLGFAVVALSARALNVLTPVGLLRDPATYALLVGGGISFGFYALALQRGRVTMVTAAVIAGETLVPAIVGVLAFGDHTRPGLAPVAVAGFAITLVAAVSLARFGEPSAPETPEPATPTSDAPPPARLGGSA